MSNTIQIKRGSSIPTTSQLAEYELGFNTTNNTLYINNGTEVVVPFANVSAVNIDGTLSITKGGTGATARKNAVDNLLYLGNNVNTILSGTTAEAGAYGHCIGYFNTSSTDSKKASNYGMVLQIASGSEISQLWMTHSDGAWYHRGMNGSNPPSSRNWHKFFDDSMTIPIANGGTGATSVAINRVFAGPGSGSAAAPSFRALVAADIPNLNASKINDGIFDVARIPNLNASKINDGTLDVARIPNLAASKITSGTLAVAQGGTGSSSLDGAGIITKSGAQTFSGVKTFGAVPVIQANARYGGLQIRPTTYTGTITNYAPAGIFVDFGSTTTISNSQFYFRQWSPNSTANTDITEFHEDYLLPSTTAGRTGHGTYNILTSKTVKYGTCTANGNASTTVSYGATFSSAPIVIATLSTTGANVSGDLGTIKIHNKTTTNFQIILGGVSASTNRNVDWIAIGTV